MTTTSGTKTRALCVATRCTSVDQFVATFYRFCGDDQTFFVATMTSRPIGLETAFSIQLADKQPVLRGLCTVLDAWTTPENRFKRPGIRLGIKRLTAESQLVFDRLRAASRAPSSLGEALVVAEATPPPGSAPLPSLGGTRPPPLAGTTRPPPLPRASAMPPPLPVSLAPPAVVAKPAPVSPSVATPPPLPPLAGPRVGLPSVRSLPPLSPETKPAVEAKPVEAKPVEAKPEEAKPALEVKPPVLPRPPVLPAVAPKPTPPPRATPTLRKTPTPIEVTRFQIALNVDTIPPPISDVEFKPSQLIPRPRVEPRIISEPPPGDEPVDPGRPAMIVDRPSEPPHRPTLPGFAPVPAATRPPPIREAVAVSEPAPAGDPAIDQRTPGSAFVLPANPLHNLSDESLEGFVDCTIYEETGNFFHPATDGGDWSDELADPPVSPLTTRATPGSVPAMPFDAAPNLTVRAIGDTESLRVAPDEAAPPVSAPVPRAGEAFYLTPPTGAHHVVPVEDPGGNPAPWFDGVAATGPAPLPEHAYTPEHPYGRHGFDPNLIPGPSGAYPALDPAMYTRVDALPSVPASIYAPRAITRAWPRWLVIGGSAVVAIILVVVVLALTARKQAPPAATIHSRATPASLPSAAPSIAPTVPAHPQPPSVARTGPPSADPAAALAPEDDGEAVAGGTPVVGSGPCRFTVATTPAGSIIRLDDQPLGPSPLTIDATCDKHKVDAAHARYQSATRWVTLGVGAPQALDINLPRPIHAVTVTSSPSGAELSIDGHRAGTTPTIVQMMGFASVNLTFTKAGFQPVTKRVYSKTPDDRVSVKLSKW